MNDESPLENDPTRPEAASVPSTELRLVHRCLLAVVGAASMGFSTTVFSSDWCCTAIGMGVVGAIVSGIEQLVMSMGWARQYRGRLSLRTGYTLVLGSAVGLLFLSDRQSVFERAFGMKPPPGLHELSIKRYYVGGPGDDAILIRFTTDQATMQQLLSARSFHEDPEAAALYPADLSWERFWGGLMGNFASSFGGEEWKTAPPMNSPKLYRAGSFGHRETKVLRDEATGRTYVLSTLG